MHCSACRSRNATGLSSAPRPMSSPLEGTAASAKTSRYSCIRTRARNTRSHGPSAKPRPATRASQFDAAPTVTLEQDLQRRDLTINAIARAEDGEIIDPWSGRADLDGARAAPRLAGVQRRPAARAARRALRRALRAARLHGRARNLELMKEIVARRRDGGTAPRACLAGNRQSAGDGASRRLRRDAARVRTRSRASFPRSTPCSAFRNPSTGIPRSTPACTR